MENLYRLLNTICPRVKSNTDYYLLNQKLVVIDHYVGMVHTLNLSFLIRHLHSDCDEGGHHFVTLQGEVYTKNGFNPFVWTKEPSIPIAVSKVCPGALDCEWFVIGFKGQVYSQYYHCSMEPILEEKWYLVNDLPPIKDVVSNDKHNFCIALNGDVYISRIQDELKAFEEDRRIYKWKIANLPPVREIAYNDDTVFTILTDGELYYTKNIPELVDKWTEVSLPSKVRILTAIDKRALLITNDGRLFVIGQNIRGCFPGVILEDDIPSWTRIYGLPAVKKVVATRCRSVLLGGNDAIYYTNPDLLAQWQRAYGLTLSNVNDIILFRRNMQLFGRVTSKNILVY